MAQLSTLRGYVRDELSEQTAGIWTDAQLNSYLNRGVEYCVGEFYRGKCWQLLRELTKDATYTVPTSETRHSMWQLIDNKTSGGSATNTWYGYIHGMLGNYVLHKASLPEFHRLNATTGEHKPSTTEPYIVFDGYDRATKIIGYDSGSTEPAIDGQIVGADGGATANIAFVPPPTSGSWTGGDAAGELYLRNDSDTYTDDEVLNYYAPDESSLSSDIATCNGTLITESHDNVPLFSLYPSLSSTASLKIWWLNKPTAMSAATDTPDVPYDCDELLVLYATARAWKANRNFDMHAAMWAEFTQELQRKVANYQELTFKSL